MCQAEVSLKIAMLKCCCSSVVALVLHIACNSSSVDSPNQAQSTQSGIALQTLWAHFFSALRAWARATNPCRTENFACSMRQRLCLSCWNRRGRESSRSMPDFPYFHVFSSYLKNIIFQTRGSRGWSRQIFHSAVNLPQTVPNSVAPRRWRKWKICHDLSALPVLAPTCCLASNPASSDSWLLQHWHRAC